MEKKDEDKKREKEKEIWRFDGQRYILVGAQTSACTFLCASVYTHTHIFNKNFKQNETNHNKNKKYTHQSVVKHIEVKVKPFTKKLDYNKKFLNFNHFSIKSATATTIIDPKTYIFFEEKKK